MEFVSSTTSSAVNISWLKNTIFQDKFPSGTFSVSILCLAIFPGASVLPWLHISLQEGDATFVLVGRSDESWALHFFAYLLGE